MYALSDRVRLGILCFLLLVVLGFLAYTTANTFQAVHSFQQQYKAVKEKDVSAIRPWMTIPVISRLYHVPEDYLYHSLNVSNPAPFRKATLYEIASNKKQPVDKVIHTLQQAILAYRKAHPTPTATQHTGRKPLTPAPGRTKY